MKQLFDVYWFHFMQAVKSKGFIISSIAIIGLLFGFLVFNAFTSDNSKADQLKFSVFNLSQNYQFDAQKIADNLQTTSDEINYVLVSDLNESEAEAAITDDTLDGIVIIDEVSGQPTLEFKFKNKPYPSLIFASEAVVKEVFALKIAREQAIDESILAQLQAPLQSTITQVDEVQLSMTTSMLIYVFAFFFYIFALTFGNLIASNIVSEKSSRVMEVMISKVKPLTLMYGKILAVLSLGIVQLLIIGGTIGLASVIGLFDLTNIGIFGVTVDFTAFTPWMIIAFVIFLLLGFALYAILFAAVGASVSKMEQLGNASFPIVLLAIAAFFIGISAMTTPTSLLVTVSAYIPFFSPIAEYARILAGVAQPLEIGLSILILIITIIGVNRLAARVYVNGVMSYHEKWTWKTLWSLIKKS
ncbi:MAG: ABC transporter permease [Culicoidibacterales bacterium]